MSPAAVAQLKPTNIHDHHHHLRHHEIKLVNETASSLKDVVLTTYSDDPNVKPLGLNWGEKDPLVRGAIVPSRLRSGLSKHNAIGAHSGSYSIYHALAVGSKQLDPYHTADYTNAEPAFNIPEQKQWYGNEKIVSMDPFGHLTPWLYDDVSKEEDVEIRPTISVTKAHMQLFEMKEAVEAGRLKVDGKIVINSNGDLNVSKVAVEPVWYLPGVAKRFGITEVELRKALFEDTNGMYPELITRPDLKVFLPPIGGLTVYIFGDTANVSDPSKRVALRIHDECNGSDVFGSDICTCRPYLTFGIEEAAKEAQNGGSGVVVYFRKEGRALGEVTKYLVYNARKRGGDTAAEYFHRTECIAGVRDMRFQQLMPDVLHWLGITKIDRMLSMSNMKHDAIVDQGIPIYERIPIPDSLIPPDSRVEIDAKIHAGYFTNGVIPSMDDLKDVKGRGWS
jgi:GTP cyclohydrolase II